MTGSVAVFAGGELAGFSIDDALHVFYSRSLIISRRFGVTVL